MGMMDARRKRESKDAPRLLTEAEMPQWLLQAETMATERRAALAEGSVGPSGPRERKKVSYDQPDGLSERDWGRLMESGLDKEGFLAAEEKRKRKLEERKGRAGSSAADDAAAAAAAAAPAEGKAAKRPKIFVAAGGGAAGAGGSDAAAGGAAGEEREKLLKLIKAVQSTQRQGRRVAALFTRLPTEDEAPGYREHIASPISLAEMNKKARGGEYTVAELDADMDTMVANAHSYNAPESQVHHDASTLLASYREARAKHFGEA